MMEYSRIKAEIDRRGLGGSDAEVAESINQIVVTKYQAIASDWLLEFALRTGLFARLKGLIADDQTAAQILYLAEGLLLLISRDNTTLCLSKAEVRAMVAQTLAAGILTQSENDELYAKATVTESLYNDLAGRPLEAEDVRIARL